MYKAIPQKQLYCFFLPQFEYYDALASESGLEACPEWYRDLFGKVLERVFRDFNFKRCRVTPAEGPGGQPVYDVVDP